MKKILFFIESLSGGGAEQVLVTFLRHLDYTRYDVTLMTVSDTGVHVDDIDYNKVHYRSLLPATENPVRNFWHKVKYKLIYHYLPASWVARWVIPSGYDTYIAFVEGYCTKIVSQMLADGKRIAWVHTNLHTNAWPLQQGIYNSFKEEQECYRQYNKVVCVSHAVEHIMREYYHLGNVTTIYNPIDTDYINYLAGMETVFVPSKDFNLVSVGRLVPQKGYDLLIPIIARLRRRRTVCFIVYFRRRGRKKAVRTPHRALCVEIICSLTWLSNKSSCHCTNDGFICLFVSCRRI